MFGDKGKWIWDGTEWRWNCWLCFRKTFTAEVADGILDITADSRYRVWVNGSLLGQGPVRGWPDQWFYDSYPVKLDAGENVIAVHVHEFGVGTFQYLPAQAGLLAELRVGDEVLLATDETWSVAEHPGFSRETLRISCQQGWAENYNAGRAELEWQDAVPVRRECSLKSSDVPALSEGPILRGEVIRARRTRPNDVWSCSLRRNLLPGYMDANPMEISGFLVTTVQCEAAREVAVETVGGWVSAQGRLRVNGEECEHIPSVAPAWHGTRRQKMRLKEGENLVVWDVSGKYHEWAFHAALDCSGLEPTIAGNRFATISARSGEPLYDAVLSCSTVEDMELVGYQLVDPVDCTDSDVTLRLAYATEHEDYGSLPLPKAFPWRLQEDTELLIDLGRMTVCYWEIDIEAPAGAAIEMLGFEAFQDGVPDLPLDMQNTLRYVCRGGRQEYRSFWRRGARYVLLRVDSAEPVTMHDFRVVEATYPAKETGSFSCSDERLNQIWKMSQLTTRLCMEDTYVDCPTYEQTFWVGDSRTEGLANYYCFGAGGISARCLRLAAQSLRYGGLVESNVPSSWRSVIPAWSFLWAFACEEYELFFDDPALLDEMLPALREQAERAWGHVDERGLLSMEAWNLADWAPMDQPGEGVVTSQNLWFGASLGSLARVYRSRGLEDEAVVMEERRAALFAAVNEHLWSQGGTPAYVDCLRTNGTQSDVVSQQNQILAILYGAATGDRLETVARYLTDPPEGMVQVGTPFFAFFWLEALVKLGRFHDMLAVIRDKWGMMLDHGATTCWELFPGFFDSGRLTRSHCHAWSAAPAYFLGAHVLGVRPLSAGFEEIAFQPFFGDLEWAKGTIPTPLGPIYVEWELGREPVLRLPDGVTLR